MVRPTTTLVQLPKPGADHPAWAKVGLIALLGFVCGFVWPRFTGTRIAPSLPGNAVARAPEAASSGNGEKAGSSGTTSAGNAPQVAASAAAVNPAPAGPSAATGVTSTAANGAAGDLVTTVGPGIIVRCRDGDEEPSKECGTLQFDPIALPVLKGLARCGPGKATSGHLSMGFDVDFRRRRVRTMLGRYTTLPSDSAQALLGCADAAMKSASLGDVKHRHQRYTVYYNVTFARSGESVPPPNATSSDGRAAGSTTGESPASGNATVAWDVLVVRDAPRTGSIVGRVVRGTKVKLVARQGEWFRVHSGSIEGWAYRGALGM